MRDRIGNNKVERPDSGEGFNPYSGRLRALNICLSFGPLWTKYGGRRSFKNWYPVQTLFY
jgi:hypothetical protein